MLPWQVDLYFASITLTAILMGVLAIFAGEKPHAIMPVRNASLGVAAVLFAVSVFSLVLHRFISLPLQPILYACFLLLMACLILVLLQFSTRADDQFFAHQQLANISEDLAIFIDDEGRVLDLNPAAQKFLKADPAQTIAQPLENVFPELHRMLFGLLPDGTENPSPENEAAPPTLEIEHQDHDHHFVVKVAAIEETPTKVAGKLLVLQDISEAIHNKQVLHSTTAALSEAAAVMTSKLDLVPVMDSIFDQIRHLFPADMILVLSVENGIGQLLHSFSNQKFDLVYNPVPLAESPILQPALQTGKPAFITDTGSDPTWAPPPGLEWVGSFICAPIFLSKELAGMIIVYNQRPGQYGPVEARQLEVFANLAGIAMQNTRFYTEIQRLATTDPLTGLNNRRYFMVLARRELDRAQRYLRALTVLMFDIDQFKRINDEYGRAVGDQILQGMGRRCLTAFRQTDILGRYGGEEFVVILPEIDLDRARQVSDRFRRFIELKPFETSAGPISINISIGVTCQNGQQNLSLDTLLDLADQAMAAEKTGGRNQVSDVPDESHISPTNSGEGEISENHSGEL